MLVVLYTRACRNRNLLVPLEGAGLDTRAARWIARLVCGGVELRTVYVQEHQMRVLLLSRLATPRAGALSLSLSLSLSLTHSLSLSLCMSTSQKVRMRC